MQYLYISNGWTPAICRFWWPSSSWSNGLITWRWRRTNISSLISFQGHQTAAKLGPTLSFLINISSHATRLPRKTTQLILSGITIDACTLPNYIFMAFWVTCYFRCTHDAIWYQGFLIHDIYASQNLGRNVVTKLPHMIGKSIPAWTGWSLLALCFLTGLNIDHAKYINYDRGFESHLRLALWVLLQESPDALNMAGPDCAPWGLPARSTTGRSVLNILGRQDLPFVNGGNCMVARLLGMNQNEIPQLKYVHGQHFNNSPYQVGGLLPSLSIPSSDLCGRESFCQFVTTAPTLELVSKCYLLGDLASNLEKNRMLTYLWWFAKDPVQFSLNCFEWFWI